MVNVLKETSYPILVTQLIPHDDKDNSILEMEYSAETNKLLVMNRIHTTQQPITMLKLSATPPYTTTMEWTGITKNINHFSIIPYSKYAIAGINSSSSHYQLFAIKNINYNPNSCFGTQPVQISAFQTFLPVTAPAVTIQGGLVANWTNYNSSKSSDTLSVDCIE